MWFQEYIMLSPLLPLKWFPLLGRHSVVTCLLAYCLVLSDISSSRSTFIGWEPFFWALVLIISYETCLFTHLDNHLLEKRCLCLNYHRPWNWHISVATKCMWNGERISGRHQPLPSAEAALLTCEKTAKNHTRICSYPGRPWSHHTKAPRQGNCLHARYGLFSWPEKNGEEKAPKVTHKAGSILISASYFRKRGLHFYFRVSGNKNILIRKLD